MVNPQGLRYARKIMSNLIDSDLIQRLSCHIDNQLSMSEIGHIKFQNGIGQSMSLILSQLSDRGHQKIIALPQQARRTGFRPRAQPRILYIQHMVD